MFIEFDIFDVFSNSKVQTYGQPRYLFVTKNNFCLVGNEDSNTDNISFSFWTTIELLSIILEGQEYFQPPNTQKFTFLKALDFEVDEKSKVFDLVSFLQFNIAGQDHTIETIRKVLFTGPSEVLLPDGTTLKVNFVNKTVIQIWRKFGDLHAERSLAIIFPEGNFLLSPTTFQNTTAKFFDSIDKKTRKYFMDHLTYPTYVLNTDWSQTVISQEVGQYYGEFEFEEYSRKAWKTQKRKIQ